MTRARTSISGVGRVAWERIAVSFLVRESRVADLVSSLMMIRFMSSEMSLQLRPILMAVSCLSPVRTLYIKHN